MKLSVPVSVGELLDKISILEIKQQKIKDKSKHANIKHELVLLLSVLRDSEIEDAICPKILTELRLKLKLANEMLWDVEEDLRLMEAKEQFDTNFIVAARSVYKHNDYRAELKHQLNRLSGSEIVEEKYYSGK